MLCLQYIRHSSRHHRTCRFEWVPQHVWTVLRPACRLPRSLCRRTAATTFQRLGNDACIFFRPTRCFSLLMRKWRTRAHTHVLHAMTLARSRQMPRCRFLVSELSNCFAGRFSCPAISPDFLHTVYYCYCYSCCCFFVKIAWFLRAKPDQVGFNKCHSKFEDVMWINYERSHQVYHSSILHTRWPCDSGSLRVALVASRWEDPVQVVLAGSQVAYGTHAGIHLRPSDIGSQYSRSIYTTRLIMWQPRRAADMSTNWRQSLFCCYTASMEQAADGAETAAIDGLVSSRSENISVWFCL